MKCARQLDNGVRQLVGIHLRSPQIVVTTKELTILIHPRTRVDNCSRSHEYSHDAIMHVPCVGWVQGVDVTRGVTMLVWLCISCTYLSSHWSHYSTCCVTLYSRTSTHPYSSARPWDGCSATDAAQSCVACAVRGAALGSPAQGPREDFFLSSFPPGRQTFTASSSTPPSSIFPVSSRYRSYPCQWGKCFSKIRGSAR